MILTNSIYYCNALIIILLFVAFVYTYAKGKQQNKEGITNMNCCGGIKSGKHYSESDKIPPRFVRRCFKSQRQGGELNYEWDGFPCTSVGSKQCCGGAGKCVPSTKGGYCKNNGVNKDMPTTYVYRRGSSDHKSFIPTSKDIDLDLNNAIQMKKYFKKNTDPALLSAREKLYNKKRTTIRNQVTKKMQDIIMKKKGRVAKNRDLLDDQKKERQIITAISIIYLVFLITFSIIIKDQIIAIIPSYYQSASFSFDTFRGKNLGK